MQKEALNTLMNILDTLSQISTNGRDTILMGQSLMALNQLIVTEQQNNSESEQKDE